MVNKITISQTENISMKTLLAAILTVLLGTSYAFTLPSANKINSISSKELGTSLSLSSNEVNVFSKPPSGSKGRILILGGSGFLGQNVARRAILEGYSVVSLSRRGKPPASEEPLETGIEYVSGDARDKSVLKNLLSGSDDAPFAAVVHCVGLLFDDSSGLGNLNRLVSGSGSVPDTQSTYDDITRQTAFNAIEAAEEYANDQNLDQPFPFIFTSAAEAGWPDVKGGPFVEKTLAPEWLRRYLVAKRAVEGRLGESQSSKKLRPIIFRPSLIYSIDRIASLPPVAAFVVGNKIGLPFVDRPVTVQSLANAAVRALGKDDVVGVQRYLQIDALNE